jgi:drug/metabolite transporter (DMT)-like permease
VELSARTRFQPREGGGLDIVSGAVPQRLAARDLCSAVVVAVVLGLLIAAAFGSGDFIGGRASSSASTVAVLVVAQACSVVGALVVALLVHAEVAGVDLAYGALAGATNVIGLGLLYRGLAAHAAGVVAPIAAVVGAVVPVTWALVRGENPSAVVLLGCAVAIVAGGLVAREPDDDASGSIARGSLQAVAAGLALGSSLVLFAETSSRSGQWPVAAARLSALLLVSIAAVAFASRGTLTFPHGTAQLFAVGAGVFDVAATVLLVVAVRRELVVVVAPFASLAPAFTVLLARVVDGERLHAAQRAGLLLALAGLVLVAVG